jgi:hypothetical protein
VLPSLLAALVLVGAHLSSHLLKFLEGLPRSRWLSAAGGASVAYVFLHLLPEIAHGQNEVLVHVGVLEESLAWLFALAGLVLFYGLERLVQHKREGESAGLHEEEAPQTGSFWLHLGSFGLYNLVTGYLLSHGEARSPANLALFTIALALHFLVTDYGLREDTAATWRRLGRWVLSAAVLAGWALGLLTNPPEAIVYGLIAFLGGGIVLNVLKEELPAERNSRIVPFVAGVVGYAGLLIAV